MTICAKAIMLAAALTAANVVQGDGREEKDDKQPTEGMKLELMALESLMKLQSGRVVVHVKTTKGPLGAPAYDLTFDIEFQENKLRVNRRDNRFESFDINIDNGVDFIHLPGVRNPDRDDYVSIMSRRLVKRKNAPDDLFHPRMLGAYPVPVAMLDRVSLEESLAGTGRTHETVKAEILDGQPVKHISYRRATGAVVDVWIAPAMGHAILKFEAAGSGSRGVLRTTYSKDKETKLWFPNRRVFTQYMKKRLVMEETVIVERADLNVVVAPTRFTLSSLPLKIGESVKKDGRYFKWDGKKLVDAVTGPAPPTGPTPQSDRLALSTIAWSSLALLCAVAAGYSFWRVSRRPAS